MQFAALVRKIDLVTRKHSPAILSAIGVSGTIATAYFTGKASFEARHIIEEEQERYIEAQSSLTKKEMIKLVWPLYIPAVISGAATITCIIMATRIGSRRTAAIASAYSISEKAFMEYKDKVVEQIGPKKEQAIRDSIAQDRVTNNNPIIVSGSGSVLCYEMHTGRYFQSDIESLKKAMNEINAMMIRENEANLNDFYYLIGIPQTSSSSAIGWTSDKLMDIHFSAVIAEDGRPCIAFDYNYTKAL